MSFFESYKHLEKICGEIYGNADKNGISAYIDEMCRISDGSRYVDNWNEDLEMLKHYRSIRNQISHEPGYTEENLCTHADEVWLDDFYSRIMTVSDPLARYTAKTKRTSQALMSSATKITYVVPRIRPNPHRRKRMNRRYADVRQKTIYDYCCRSPLVSLLFLSLYA